MAVTQVMKDIDQTNKELQTSAHIAAGSLDDPAQKKRLLAALDELGQLFPVVSDLAQKYVIQHKKNIYKRAIILSALPIGLQMIQKRRTSFIRPMPS